jgi:hypothetical protein
MNNNTLKYLKTKIFWTYFVFIFLISLHLLLIIQNFNFIFESLRIGISFLDSISTIYDFFNTYTKLAFFILLATLIISSFNLSLLIEYFRLQKNINENMKNKNQKDSSGKKMGAAMTLAYLASHCASCGAVLFGGLISASFLTYLPFGGVELGAFGIVIMLYVSYDIINKLNNPYVC